MVFDFGIPIASSVVEMYTKQRYIQGLALQYNALTHLSALISTFGETITARSGAPPHVGKAHFCGFPC